MHILSRIHTQIIQRNTKLEKQQTHKYIFSRFIRIYPYVIYPLKPTTTSENIERTKKKYIKL